MTGIAHGGRLDRAIARYGGDAADWLDLSTGINPVSYPMPDLPGWVWQRLPDEALEQRTLEAARNYYQVPEDCSIIMANGTQALIELLPKAFPERSPIILGPTYGEHAHVWEKHCASPKTVTAFEELNGERVLATVVNPNNPTGLCFSPDHLTQLAEKLEEQQSSLIVDEAFCDAVPKLSLVPHLPNNTVVLKSFGKFFGLAGLRIGFAIAKEPMAKDLRRLIGPWNVSGPALHVAAIAMEDTSWIAENTTRLEQRSSALSALLSDQGFQVEGRAALFVYVRHERAEHVHEALMRRHILTRRFDDQPEHLRFGLCADDAQLSRLGQALSECARV